jgi:hypothetical protein
LLAGFVEGDADGFDAAIHHVGGGDDVGSGLGERGGGFGDEGYAGVVFDGIVVTVAGDEAAVAVGGVLTEADVGDEDEGIEGTVLFEGAEALLDDALFVPGAGALFVFGFGEAEEEEATDAEGGAGLGLFEGFVKREVEDAGHGGDLAADAFTGAEEEGVDEGGGAEMGLADEGTEGLGAAKTPHAGCGEVHDF